MKRKIIQRPSDGKFWIMGIDCADSWTSDPLRATPRGYLYLDDTLEDVSGDEDYLVVEIEVTATLTGRTTNDLFRDGMDIDEWGKRGKRQCQKGLHSWSDDPTVRDPEFECERKGCSERYGYV